MIHFTLLSQALSLKPNSRKILATLFALPTLAISLFTSTSHAEVCSQGTAGYRIELPAVFNSNSTYFNTDTGVYRTRLTRGGAEPIALTLLCTPASYPPRPFRPFPMSCRTEDGVYTVTIAPDRSRPGQQLALVSHANSRTPVPCTR